MRLVAITIYANLGLDFGHELRQRISMRGLKIVFRVANSSGS